MSLDGVLGEAFASGLWRAPFRRATSILQVAMAPGPLDAMPFRMGMPMEWAGAIPPVPVVTIPDVIVLEAELEVAPPASTVVCPKPQARSARLTPSAEDAADRAKVIAVWIEILTRLGCATEAYDKCGGVFTEANVQVYMASPKATGTLTIRASSWTVRGGGRYAPK
jgi:hypothetical protein